VHDDQITPAGEARIKKNAIHSLYDKNKTIVIRYLGLVCGDGHLVAAHVADDLERVRLLHFLLVELVQAHVFDTQHAEGFRRLRPASEFEHTGRDAFFYLTAQKKKKKRERAWEIVGQKQKRNPQERQQRN
jgi:hypothetical protein